MKWKNTRSSGTTLGVAPLYMTSLLSLRCICTSAGASTRASQRWARRLSNFAIQIQPGFWNSLQVQYIFQSEVQGSWCPNSLKNTALSQQKCYISFALTQSKFGPVPKLWRDLQFGSNPIATKIAIVQIQYNPEVATDPGCRSRLLQDSSFFFRTRIRGPKFLISWTRIRGHFSSSLVAGVTAMLFCYLE